MPSHLAVFILGIVGGLGLGFIGGAAIAGAGVLWAKRVLDGYTARITAEAAEKALGMVRDITQVRAATPASITPHLDAIAAADAAWEFGRKQRLAAEADKRFNKELDQ